MAFISNDDATKMVLTLTRCENKATNEQQQNGTMLHDEQFHVVANEIIVKR
jgi:hypothetical protein